MDRTITARRRLHAGLAGSAIMALAATGVLAAGAGTATAAPHHDKAAASAQCSGRNVPVSRISVQLYSYAAWINQLTAELGSSEAALDHLFGQLAAIGYRDVQPWAGMYAMVSAEELEALLKKHRLRATSGQYRYDDANFGEFLDYADDIGHKYTGSGGFGQPGTSTLESTLATAEQMNRLGELSVKNGTGKLFGHNHTSEFTTMFADPETGETKSAWQLLVENTDPRWVTFEVDVFWAAAAGVDVAALIEQYGDRIELLHIKDGDYVGTQPSREGFAKITDVGEGDIDWGPILRAAHGKVKLYVVERDAAPSTIEFAEDSFDFLSCYRY